MIGLNPLCFCCCVHSSTVVKYLCGLSTIFNLSCLSDFYEELLFCLCMKLTGALMVEIAGNLRHARNQLS